MARAEGGFFALIENIYFSVNIPVANYEDYFNLKLKKPFNEFRNIAQEQEYFLFDEVEVLPRGINRYAFAYQIKDKFNVYFASKTGDNFPIFVIVSAQFLHLNSVEYVIEYIKNIILTIILKADIDFSLNGGSLDLKLSRIDICNHNNVIDMKNYIKIDEFNARQVSKIKKCFPVVELVGDYGQIVPYFRYGKGSLAVRFYNKLKEVCEMRSKSFFIQLWKERGLINDYEFKIYDYIYKLNGDYNIDYFFTNILYSETSEEIKLIAKNIYYDNKKPLADKYDDLNELIINNNIVLVKEIINVEFQVRNDYLKSIKVIDKETGEKIDFNILENILKHTKEFYEYLTHISFRVVDRDSKAERKRDKKTCPIWQVIQKCEVKNLEDFKQSNAEIIREYQKENDELNALNKVVTGLSRLYYLKSRNIDHEEIKNLDFYDLLSNAVVPYYLNENFINFKTKLDKQIFHYGIKKDNLFLKNTKKNIPKPEDN